MEEGQNSVGMTDFESNVFINCPFDAHYFPLLKALLYTIKRAGLKPRLALESLDSGEVRLAKIQQLITSAKYSIHDLSRSKSKSPDEYFRLNMPLELGIDIGCRDYHENTAYREKKMLILEEEKYSTQKALSDLSFADCKCHKGNAEELVYEVRNWFVELGMKTIPPASKIWDGFNIFLTDLYESKQKQGYRPKDIERLPIPEFLQFIEAHNSTSDR